MTVSITEEDLRREEDRQARERRLDRRSRVTMWLSIGFCAILLLLALPVLSTSQDVGASRRTDEIAACRSVFNGDLNEARTSRSEAAAAASDARDDVEEARSLLTEIAIFEDPDSARLTDLRTDLAAKRLAVVRAQEALNDATAEERLQNDIQRERSQLSLDNPDAFLDLCKEQP